MSFQSSTADAPSSPQSLENHSPDPSNTLNGSVNPPQASQLRTELGSQPNSATAEPGDSRPLPPFHGNLLNDGITDQISRRAQRRPIVIAALFVLGAFTVCLIGVVFTLGVAFHQALKPDNIAKFVAVELRGKVNEVASKQAEKAGISSKLEKPSPASDKDAKAINAKTDSEDAVAKEAEPIKVEAKIYGEIRDSMVPLVALVSILTVAVIVILGTMLKAAFSPHPNSGYNLAEKNDTSPVPLLEALKSLIESVKAAWK
ncbi:hypothetical protein AB2N08_12580 [Massilia aurea]|uniref:hypothetical protein n=1 Tax=Massilia aurea TaxID=373040 RepID=UPI003462ECDB